MIIVNYNYDDPCHHQHHHHDGDDQHIVILVIIVIIISISITMMTCAMELSGASAPAARDHHLQTSLAHTMTCNIKHSNISNIVRCALPAA